ncbi:hypothetical protein [Sinorhizobium psoraleae]|uniref:Uncharacterized protein n=1 Tax=Sinorhizobium psoraleae TaxID=520838 RepID=A0ABT4KQQ9_9HYPH|nr:hypothetical protein [Sinorhizobium psoraleae]MCZ4094267.1 hypothetical protein [Sinorhizobium psoraleae]
MTVLQGGPVLTGATIKTVPRVVTVEPKEAEPTIKEDWDHLLLGRTLIDTLFPYARNPAPFSTHELRYFTNQWIAAMSGDDRRVLSGNPHAQQGQTRLQQEEQMIGYVKTTKYSWPNCMSNQLRDSGPLRKQFLPLLTCDRVRSSVLRR